MLGLAPQGAATRLLLVRHCETDASMRGRCYGSLDVQLSSEGRRHAAALGQALAGVPLGAVYASPLARALDTAAAVATRQALEVSAVTGLRELDFGELEGRSYDDIRAERPRLYEEWMAEPTSVCFPGGESFRELRARVRPAVLEIRERHEGEAVALVAHGGVIRVVLADALGLSDGAVFRLAQSPGGLSVVDWVGGGAVVSLVNAVLYSAA